jgi:undecaprenyl pyrophosphate synthase
MKNPNNGIGSKEALKKKIREATFYHIVQFGYRDWIIEALEEVAREVKTGQKENRPPGHFMNG